MRTLVLVVSLTAACSGTDKEASPTGPGPVPVTSGTAEPTSGSGTAVTANASPPAAPVAPAPGMLLGQVPTTSSYRVIACAFGPEKRRTCEGLVERLVGTEVRGPTDGTAARIAKIGVVKASDGDGVAVELANPSGAVVASSATLLRKPATLTEAETMALRKQTRTISPRAKWATGERFEVIALEADLDGDRNADRIALGTLVDFKKDAERVIVVVAVGVAGKPFEIVEWKADRAAILGTVDLNGDGRDEVLVDGTLDKSATSYHYALMHVLPGKPLAMDLKKPAGSEGWQPYDVLEDHVRD